MTRAEESAAGAMGAPGAPAPASTPGPAAAPDPGPLAEAVWASGSPAETQALARLLGAAARAGDVVLLVGPLGAGKTCFVQGLARGMGVTGPVKSPTFVLLVEHPGPVPLAHLDLYRVDGTRPLDELGLEEEMDAHVLAVEWGEKLAGRLDDGLVVELAETGPQERRLSARALGSRGREWLARWRAAASPPGRDT